MMHIHRSQVSLWQMLSLKRSVCVSCMMSAKLLTRRGRRPQVIRVFDLQGLCSIYQPAAGTCRFGQFSPNPFYLFFELQPV